MGEIFIFTVTIIVVIVLLGRYAIIEGQRKEQQKKFYKNLEKFDKKHYVESSKRNK
jgi:hypothetical protein